jgi:hypothetical protein
MIDRNMTRQQRRIEQRLLAFLVVGTLLISPSRAAPQLCPGSTTEFGYSTIANINADITSEISRIQSGATANGMYTYSLCSNTIFDASAGPLRPGLSNSFFVCGPDGKPTNNCTIKGGSVQVEIDNSVIPNYQLGEMTFIGMQFTGFTKQAVSASAAFPTQANFQNVLWTVRSMQLH